MALAALVWLLLLALVTACDHHRPNNNTTGRHEPKGLTSRDCRKTSLFHFPFPRRTEAKTPRRQQEYEQRHLVGEGRCGTRPPTLDEIAEIIDAEHRWLANGNRHRNLKKTWHVIDVYWHTLRAGTTLKRGAFKNKWIKQAIKAVNKAFLGTPFKFKLAGVEHVTEKRWFNCKHDNKYTIEREYKQALRVPGSDVLNIYMCDLIGNQGLYGYSYMPPELQWYPVFDGITLANAPMYGDPVDEVFGTLIHEIGHFLGLYHTWTNRCSPGTKRRYGGQYDSYVISGDGIRDTAAHIGSTWKYEGSENCFQKTGTDWDTCPDKLRGVDSGKDPVLNHMNYVRGECAVKLGQFTPAQQLRMLSQFETFRRPPTMPPTRRPTQSPTRFPTGSPTQRPTRAPTQLPTLAPSSLPSKQPSEAPVFPTPQPQMPPTNVPAPPTQQPHAPTAPSQAPFPTPQAPLSETPSPPTEQPQPTTETPVSPTEQPQEPVVIPTPPPF